MRRNLNKGDVSQGREDHEDHNSQAPLQRDHYGGSTTSPKRQGFQEKSWFPIWTQAAEVCGRDCVKGAQFSSSLRSEDKRSGYADPLHFL